MLPGFWSCRENENYFCCLPLGHHLSLCLAGSTFFCAQSSKFKICLSFGCHFLQVETRLVDSFAVPRSIRDQKEENGGRTILSIFSPRVMKLRAHILTDQKVTGFHPVWQKAHHNKDFENQSPTLWLSGSLASLKPLVQQNVLAQCSK